MFETMEIEGQVVEVSSIMPKQCGNYVVYNKKLYRITVIEGYGENFCICLEKPSTQERFFVSGANLKQVRVVTKPSGWMGI